MATAIALYTFLAGCTIALVARWITSHATEDRGTLSVSQKDPFWGLDIVYQRLFKFDKTHINQNWEAQFKKNGDTFRSRPFGQTEIFTTSPKIIESVHSKDFGSFGVEAFRRKAISPLVGPGIVSADGEEWKIARKLISPAFVLPHGPNLRFFDLHVSRLLERLPLDGSTVDLQPLFHMLSLDASTEFIFGESFNSLGPNGMSIERQKFLDAFNYAITGIDKRLWLRSWNPFIRNKRFWHCCAIAQAHFDKAVETCALQRSSRYADELKDPVLVHELLEQTDDRLFIRHQLMNTFLPSHDSIGVLLTNVFFVLARQPMVWFKLQEEVTSIGDSELNASDLKKLIYLQAVIQETLRLYPSLGMRERVALRDTTLSRSEAENTPLLVRKGDVIMISSYALQRRKDLWGADADEFRPERFLDAKLEPWTIISFGAGPRACPGQRIGIFQVAYTIVRILRTYTGIENRDPVMGFEELQQLASRRIEGHLAD
ncbi:hypothetical protein HO133_007184 [Letharia lupina]|uniref:Cytochrome P450 n=1 Tax=Letharia lupina TaxID=560253 RepID=A0A8H6FIB4_9LECA|nr:uncharacterized protein HO133_007184 [Letharia lupina]KAF6229070.1 hypothetical protein HO133_007184 [Letharia lupina]